MQRLNEAHPGGQGEQQHGQNSAWEPPGPELAPQCRLALLHAHAAQGGGGRILWPLLPSGKRQHTSVSAIKLTPMLSRYR